MNAGRSPLHDSLHKTREATRAIVQMEPTEKLVNAAHQALAASRRQTNSETYQKMLFDAGSKLEKTQDPKVTADERRRLAVEADGDVATLLGEIHRLEPD